MLRRADYREELAGRVVTLQLLVANLLLGVGNSLQGDKGKVSEQVETQIQNSRMWHCVVNSLERPVAWHMEHLCRRHVRQTSRAAAHSTRRAVTKPLTPLYTWIQAAPRNIITRFVAGNEGSACVLHLNTSVCMCNACHDCSLRELMASLNERGRKM